MVVPVLITSCQVSEKPKSGPVAAQTRTTMTAVTKAQERPDWKAAHWAAREKGDGEAMRAERRMAGDRCGGAG